MTAGGVWSEVPGFFKVVAVAGATLIGGVKAWTTMESKIEAKADAGEVQALRNELSAMARDIRTIRLMLCENKSADSYCRIP
jgi:hypothetical protein